MSCGPSVRLPTRGSPPAARAHADRTTTRCRPARVVGDFTIQGLVGEGGFGIVYRAFDNGMQREVALKEYMPNALARRRADGQVELRAPQYEATFHAGRKSFVNEAKLLAQFDHKALVKVLRFFEANDTAYMVMPLYHGPHAEADPARVAGGRRGLDQGDARAAARRARDAARRALLPSRRRARQHPDPRQRRSAAARLRRRAQDHRRHDAGGDRRHQAGLCAGGAVRRRQLAAAGAVDGHLRARRGRASCHHRQAARDVGDAHGERSGEAARGSRARDTARRSCARSTTALRCVPRIGRSRSRSSARRWASARRRRPCRLHRGAAGCPQPALRRLHRLPRASPRASPCAIPGRAPPGSAAGLAPPPQPSVAATPPFATQRSRRRRPCCASDAAVGAARRRRQPSASRHRRPSARRSTAAPPPAAEPASPVGETVPMRSHQTSAVARTGCRPPPRRRPVAPPCTPPPRPQWLPIAIVVAMMVVVVGAGYLVMQAVTSPPARDTVARAPAPRSPATPPAPSRATRARAAPPPAPATEPSRRRRDAAPAGVAPAPAGSPPPWQSQPPPPPLRRRPPHAEPPAALRPAGNRACACAPARRDAARAGPAHAAAVPATPPRRPDGLCSTSSRGARSWSMDAREA